jgi:hypothetical protein
MRHFEPTIWVSIVIGFVVLLSFCSLLAYLRRRVTAVAARGVISASIVISLLAAPVILNALILRLISSPGVCVHLSPVSLSVPSLLVAIALVAQGWWRREAHAS